MTKKYMVSMHCASCGQIIGKALKKIGVEAQTNPVLKIVKVTFDENKITPEQIVEVISKTGYYAIEK